MTRPSLAVSLYLLNGTLLLTHEIDSAYWKEWELFGIGGGIQLFLAINFLMALAVLVGLQKLLQGNRAGHVFSLGLAASGIRLEGPTRRLPGGLLTRAARNRATTVREWSPEN
jgi:hypothetical protein